MAAPVRILVIDNDQDVRESVALLLRLIARTCEMYVACIDPEGADVILEDGWTLIVADPRDSAHTPREVVTARVARYRETAPYVLTSTRLEKDPVAIGFVLKGDDMVVPLGRALNGICGN